MNEETENKLSIINTALNWSYDKAINGLGTFAKAENFANEYLKSNNNHKINAANSLIRWQNTKAATSGFLCNLGGIITLPVSIPSNMASSLYIQLRMISAIAHIGGHDIYDDRVKTLCYVCLTGNSAADIIKQAGIQFGKKFTASAIQKYITGEMLKTINKAVGFRLITKAGSTGIINLTKIVPVLGGIVGGSFDGIITNKIGNVARDTFIEKETNKK